MSGWAQNHLRRRVYRQLDPRAWERPGLSPLNTVIVVAILVSVGIAITQTEPSLSSFWAQALDMADLVSLGLFAIEYFARLWAAAESPIEGSVLHRRWAFIRSSSAILDLIVVVSGFAPMILPNLAVLRFARLVRIGRMGRLGRFSRAIDHLRYAITSHRAELLLTVILAVMLLVIGASALYWAEGDVQPDKFGSIPRALWWAVITLTTIGYGDVFPVTSLGKVIAGVVAMAGVGVVALPTGILAAGFREAIERDRHERGRSDQK